MYKIAYQTLSPRVTGKNKSFTHVSGHDSRMFDKNVGEYFFITQIDAQKAKAQKVNDLLIEVFEEEFCKKNSGAPSQIPEVFESTIGKINKICEVTYKEKYLEEDEKIHASIIVIKNNEIFLASTDEMTALLFRKNKVIELTQVKPSKNKTTNIFENLISGNIQTDDILMFTTPEFTNYLSQEKIRRTIQKSSIKMAAQEFEEILHETDNLAALSALFMGIETPAYVRKSVTANSYSDEAKEEEKEPVEHEFPSISLQQKEATNKKKDTPLTNITGAVQKATKEITAIFSPNHVQKQRQELEEERLNQVEKPVLNSDDTSHPIQPTPQKESKMYGALEEVSKRLKMPSKRILYIGGSIAVVIVLIITITSTVRARNDQKVKSNDEALIGEAFAKEKAASDALIYNDFDKAATYVNELEDIVTNQINDTEKYSEEIQTLNTRKEEHLNVIHQVAKVNIEEIANVSPEQDGNMITGLNDQMFVFSKNASKVFELNTDSKTFEAFNTEAEGIKQLDLLEFNAQKNTIAFLAKDTIAEMPLYLKKISEQKSEFPLPDHKFTDMAIYGDKIYLLDPQNNQIFRFIRTVDGYGTGKEWITSENQAIQDATSIAIDGNVYVLKANGSIAKFNRGTEQEFSIDPLEPALSEKTTMHTSDNLASIYILDKTQKRIFVISKSGELQTQFAFSHIDDPQDIYVNEETEELFLLTSTKLLKLSEK